MQDPLLSPSYEDEYPRFVINAEALAKYKTAEVLPLLKTLTDSVLGPTERIPVFLELPDGTQDKKGSVSRKNVQALVELVSLKCLRAYDENRAELSGNNVFQLILEDY